MTMKNRRECGLLVAVLLVLAGCNESKQGDISMTTQISPTEWQALDKNRVVFGHQSVGNNILKGIEQLAARDNVKVNIDEQRSAPVTSGISHFLIGKNGDPKSKIQDFADAINAGASQGANIAMMKLCYEDFSANIDAQQLASDYITSLDSLAKKHPNTRFVAVTAPLMAVQTGPKAWIKRLMGREPNGYSDNVRRGEFNAMLRKHYLSDGRLFDLAKAETAATGQPCVATVDGKQVEALCPEITNDGGHLNEHGQMLVGAALVNFISSLATK